MWRRVFIYLLLSLVSTIGVAHAQEDAAATCSTCSTNKVRFGVINFESCILQSKFGHQEQEKFTQIEDQIKLLGDDLQNKIEEINEQLADEELTDRLSPAALEELQTKKTRFEQEYFGYRNQESQLLYQAKMQLVEEMRRRIGQVAPTVAEQLDLHTIMPQDLYLYFRPSEDVTAAVIEELDRLFETEQPPETHTRSLHQEAN